MLFESVSAGRQAYLTFPRSGPLARNNIAQPKIFASWLRPQFQKDWLVYSKPPFSGPGYVLRYLGRYTHRVESTNLG
jgi:hypothetical protein